MVARIAVRLRYRGKQETIDGHSAFAAIVCRAPACPDRVPFDRGKGRHVGGHVLDEARTHVGRADRLEYLAGDRELAAIGKQLELKALPNARLERAEGQLAPIRRYPPHG